MKYTYHIEDKLYVLGRIKITFNLKDLNCIK